MTHDSDQQDSDDDNIDIPSEPLRRRMRNSNAVRGGYREVRRLQRERRALDMSTDDMSSSIPLMRSTDPSSLNSQPHVHPYSRGPAPNAWARDTALGSQDPFDPDLTDTQGAETSHRAPFQAEASFRTVSVPPLQVPENMPPTDRSSGLSSNHQASSYNQASFTGHSDIPNSHGSTTFQPLGEWERLQTRPRTVIQRLRLFWNGNEWVRVATYLIIGGLGATLLQNLGFPLLGLAFSTIGPGGNGMGGGSGRF